MTHCEIERAIELSWSIDTTYCVDDYAARGLAWGNCAVTALLLQELMGGELMQGNRCQKRHARKPNRHQRGRYGPTVGFATSFQCSGRSGLFHQAVNWSLPKATCWEWNSGWAYTHRLI